MLQRVPPMQAHSQVQSQTFVLILKLHIADYPFIKIVVPSVNGSTPLKVKYCSCVPGSVVLTLPESIRT
jgi:hypothetical protein